MRALEIITGHVTYNPALLTNSNWKPPILHCLNLAWIFIDLLNHSSILSLDKGALDKALAMDTLPAEMFGGSDFWLETSVII